MTDEGEARAAVGDDGLMVMLAASSLIRFTTSFLKEREWWWSTSMHSLTISSYFVCRSSSFFVVESVGLSFSSVVLSAFILPPSIVRHGWSMVGWRSSFDRATDRPHTGYRRFRLYHPARLRRRESGVTGNTDTNTIITKGQQEKAAQAEVGR